MSITMIVIQQLKQDIMTLNWLTVHQILSGVPGGRLILNGTIYSVPETELNTLMID